MGVAGCLHEVRVGVPPCSMEWSVGVVLVTAAIVFVVVDLGGIVVTDIRGTAST